jgi:hypothetical protein
MFELDLHVAVGGEDLAAEFSDFGSPAAFSADGGVDERARPEAVHGVDEHPGAAIAEAEASGSFGKGAVDFDLFEEVGAGFGEGGESGDLDPEFSAQLNRAGMGRFFGLPGHLSVSEGLLHVGVGGDDDFSGLDDGDGGFSFFELEALGGGDGDEGDDLVTGADVDDDLGHDGAHFYGSYFSRELIACAEGHGGSLIIAECRLPNADCRMPNEKAGAKGVKGLKSVKGKNQ